MICKGYERIDAPDVYDGLDSTSTEVALSARQGNILNEKINRGRLVTKLTLTSDTQIVTIGGNIMAMITSLVQFRTVMYNKVSEIVKSYNALNQKKDQGTSETEPEE